MFSSQKTLIDTKYKCQKKKKSQNFKILCKYSERYVVKQSASNKRVITWSADKLWIFLSDYVSILQFESQKVWSRSVDICRDGKGKTWRGVDSNPPSWNRIKKNRMIM